MTDTAAPRKDTGTPPAAALNPVRAARQAIKQNQTEFGEAVGLGLGPVAQMAVSRIESGDRLLDIATAGRIVMHCRAHGVDLRLEDFLPAGVAA